MIRMLVVSLSLLAFVGAGARISSRQILSALPTDVEWPVENPTTAEKVALGRLLFWDPVLSGPRDVACATCHHPNSGYADNLDLSIGVSGVGIGVSRRFTPGTSVPFVKRNSQTVLNTAFNGLSAAGRAAAESAPMFWDLRVRSLEAQALEPLKAFEEMRGAAYPEHEAVDRVVARIADIEEYRTLFQRAFGGTAPVNATNLGRAIAAFERTLVATDSPFDRYMRGDTAAMTPEQVRGMGRFQNAGCANCHSGPMFSDFRVHVLGVEDNRKLSSSDTGVEGRYAFRTPSLRNLAFTAPYMHNGIFGTLDEVLGFYNTRTTRNSNIAPRDLDPLFRQVTLVGGRAEIVEFLRALSDDAFDRTIPDRVPSGLSPGGNVQ